MNKCLNPECVNEVYRGKFCCTKCCSRYHYLNNTKIKREAQEKIRYVFTCSCGAIVNTNQKKQKQCHTCSHKKHPKVTSWECKWCGNSILFEHKDLYHGFCSSRCRSYQIEWNKLVILN